MKKGSCQLCRSRPARMYCESDGASLCWDCDANVHSANFLVAKHSRCLLCNLCQSLTPWLASGTDLGHTLSVCLTCAAYNRHKKQQHQAAAQSHPQIVGAERDRSDEDTQEDDDEVSDSDQVEYVEGNYQDEERAENQVVPWSCSPSLPYPGMSFSSSGDLSSFTTSPAGGTVSSVRKFNKYCEDINAAGSEENDADCSSVLDREDASTTEVTSSPAASEAQEASIRLIRSYYRPRMKVIRLSRQEGVVTPTEVGGGGGGGGGGEEMVRMRKRFKLSTGSNDDDKVSNGGSGSIWDMQNEQRVTGGG